MPSFFTACKGPDGRRSAGCQPHGWRDGFLVKLIGWWALAAGLAVMSTALAAESDRVQLPYATPSAADLHLPPEEVLAAPLPPLPRDLPGRQIPPLTLLSELDSAPLTHRAVPLPLANTLAHVHYQQRRFGRILENSGRVTWFNPETILLKCRGQSHVCALRVEPQCELAAVRRLAVRPDVEFAELDTFEQRQFTPNDPLLSRQWQHGVIGSFQAWNYSLGSPAIQVAIVDTPFQMDHPDLLANTIPGWDVVANAPVTASAGIFHSTMCAGLVAAAINNGAGGAGVANCQILPININGAISEMYNAVIWAADHGVRVVNISWSGASDPALETAGYYLKTNTAGLLVMSALDGSGYYGGTNQPDVYCISMTDAADNFQGTEFGPYIDFSAPGYQIYSTTVGGGYAYGTGCSFAAPVFAGVVAWIMGSNPALGPDDIISMLKNTAVDLGPSGWDEYYGWGRVDFGAAALATEASLPNISSVQWANNQLAVSTLYDSTWNYTLWRTSQLPATTWLPVTNVLFTTNGGVITLTDPAPPSGQSFYRIAVSP
jgi:hypothetical protein